MSLANAAPLRRSGSLSGLRWPRSVHGPYEVPQKFRALFPADKSCAVPGGTQDCCAWTERGLHDCKVASKEGICKCPNDQMAFQPPGFNCPPGARNLR